MRKARHLSWLRLSLLIRCARTGIIPCMFNRIVRGLEMGITLLILALLVNYGNPSLSDPIEKVRAYTRQIEFNYVTWMANAAMLKLRSASIGVP